MDKEVKELIEQLEEYASGGGSGLYPFEESVKALLDYINQLETNIAEAIKLLLDNTADYTDGDFESMRFQNDIVKILERGKEND